ncbi:DUF2569 domain-containing protein [Paraferrimonas sp. SM1919]|uniref:DUF2569 domain-containing protein n=1 Tax=Paraferrimonas sp. SM1919 TaxID=2662263 RepID=UPI0013D3817D|nr:DUF2569 domain-containing protein [Paraferrimonas sp. SM1919]
MSNTQPKGLGGWLILLAIGLIFTPVRLVYEYLPLYQELFDQGFWEIFTTPSSEYYHPLWAPFIIGEIMANSFIVLACIFLIFAFFAKSRIFPKGYIFIMLFSMVLIPLDAWLATNHTHS